MTTSRECWTQLGAVVLVWFDYLATFPGHWYIKTTAWSQAALLRDVMDF